jgi:hypothetical protein
VIVAISAAVRRCRAFCPIVEKLDKPNRHHLCISGSGLRLGLASGSVRPVPRARVAGLQEDRSAVPVATIVDPDSLIQIKHPIRTKDFQEAFRIQVEYFQSQLKAAAEDASQISTQLGKSFNRSTE